MNDQPDKLFSARLSDLVNRCRRDCCGVFSPFLDERQCAEAEQWCRRNTGELMYMFSGGFPESRRKMLAIYPDYCEAGITECFPMRCVTFSFRKEDTVTHRDILGSLMALRLKRETIGDIVVGEGIAQAAVTEVAAKDITASVSRIGRVGVKVTDERPFELVVEQQFKEISGTVASLRLDCVTALAANISREKAAALIRGEKTDVNHFTATEVSKELCQGDVLSIRGCGRFILSGINGVSKKNRIHIILRKYI